MNFKNPFITILLILFFVIIFPLNAAAQTSCEDVSGGGPQLNDSSCSSERICFPGIPRKLLPTIPEARPGYCGIKPSMIVMHTTHGGENTANDLWNYFASGDRFASTQFVVGRDGSMMQMLDMFTDQVEVGHAVGGYNDRSVSIELNNPGNYSSKSEVPPAQYEAALRMVKSLMQTYSISVTGVVSHGSLGGGAGDPGEGFMRDFIADLPNAQPLDGSPIGNGSTQQGSTGKRTDTACLITQVGEPTAEKPSLPSECLSGGGGGLPGQPLPSNEPSEVAQIMCNDYRICPTNSDSSWTLDELTALWNVVQRIAASSSYKNFITPPGGPVVEVQRISHCPGCASWVMGYQAGVGTGGSTISGSSLLYITDNSAGEQPIAFREWLYAHEIGHIAQHVATTALQAVNNCGESVSEYGRDNGRNENWADSISYYMTTGEQVTSGYLGGSDNLKTDFTCTYSALQSGLFGGVEY